MEAYKKFNSDVDANSIEYDIVNSIIDDIIENKKTTITNKINNGDRDKDQIKNIECGVTCLEIKNKLREEGYWVTQTDISKFINKFKDFYNLDFYMNNISNEPVHRIYYKRNETYDAHKKKETYEKYFYICKYSSKFLYGKLSSYFYIIESESPGKAKYAFNKCLLDSCFTSKIEYCNILVKKLPINIFDSIKNYYNEIDNLSFTNGFYFDLVDILEMNDQGLSNYDPDCYNYLNNW